MINPNQSECAEHKGNPTLSYCGDCQRPLCNCCLATHDLSHSIQSLQQIALELLRDLKSIHPTDIDSKVADEVNALDAEISTVLQSQETACKEIKRLVCEEVDKCFSEMVFSPTRKLQKEVFDHKEESDLGKIQHDVETLSSQVQSAVKENSLAQILALRTPVSSLKKPHLSDAENSERLGQWRQALRKASELLRPSGGLLSEIHNSVLTYLSGKGNISEKEESKLKAPETVLPPEPNTTVGRVDAIGLRLYNVEKAAWTTVEPANVSLKQQAELIVVRHKLYVVGGTPGASCTFEYDLNQLGKSAQFVPRADLNLGRRYHALTEVAGQEIFALGGRHNTKTLNECEKYDILADKWICIKPLNERKDGVSACTISNSRIYCVGGWDGKQALGSIEFYEVEQLERGWKMLDFVQDGSWVGIFWAALFPRAGGEILIFGGTDRTHAADSCFVFDPKTLWVSSANCKLAEPAKFAYVTRPVLYCNSVFAMSEDGQVHVHLPMSKAWKCIHGPSAAAVADIHK